MTTNGCTVIAKINNNLDNRRWSF